MDFNLPRSEQRKIEAALAELIRSVGNAPTEVLAFRILRDLRFWGYRITKSVRGKAPRPVERFMACVSPEPTTGCWLWVGSGKRSGCVTAAYPNFYGENGSEPAHRWAYRTFVGPIESGLHIDHICSTPGCVNPEHLEAVTQAENNRRRGRRQAQKKEQRRAA